MTWVIAVSPMTTHVESGCILACCKSSLVSVFLGSFVWLTKHNHSFSVIYGGQCEGGRHVSV